MRVKKIKILIIIIKKYFWKINLYIATERKRRGGGINSNKDSTWIFILIS